MFIFEYKQSDFRSIKDWRRHYLNFIEPAKQEVASVVRQMATQVVIPVPGSGLALDKAYQLESTYFPVNFTKGDHISVTQINYLTRGDIGDIKRRYENE